MDLVKAPKISVEKPLYTCPSNSGCTWFLPICGMDLVPIEPVDTEENKSYLDLLHKMKVALLSVQFFNLDDDGSRITHC
jgi:Cu2+-exporting ATPase